MRTKKYDVITALDLCLDLIMAAADMEIEFGQKEKLMGSCTMELGGSSAIFAAQAVRLGLTVGGIGKLGDDDLGRIALSKLDALRIDRAYIHTDPLVRTGIGVALCKDDDRQIFTFTGSIDAVQAADFTDDILASAQHLHISSFFLTKKLQPHYAAIIRRFRAGGGTVSLDTNWDPDERWQSHLWEVLPLVDIFFPNAVEAKYITGKSTVEEAVAVLLNYVPLVALKQGREGATVYTPAETFHAEALEVSVTDTVGAGDCFNAGFVYGYLRGYDYKTCLRMGNVCGGLSASKAGGINGQPSAPVLLRSLTTQLTEATL